MEYAASPAPGSTPQRPHVVTRIPVGEPAPRIQRDGLDGTRRKGQYRIEGLAPSKPHLNWASHVEAVLVTPRGEVPLFYIGVDELLKNKEATSRPKDFDDLDYLRRAKGG